MNARLRKVKDGTGAIRRNEVVWFDVRASHGTPVITRKESGEIYWPFALVWNCTTSDDHRYDLVHLPSGYWVTSGGIGLARRRALGLAKRLRASADWSFTGPAGKKWEAARKACMALVQRARKDSWTSEAK